METIVIRFHNGFMPAASLESRPFHCVTKPLLSTVILCGFVKKNNLIWIGNISVTSPLYALSKRFTFVCLASFVTKLSKWICYYRLLIFFHTFEIWSNLDTGGEMSSRCRALLLGEFRVSDVTEKLIVSDFLMFEIDGCPSFAAN